LGAARPDAGAAISLQLENAVGHRGDYHLEFLLSFVLRAIKGPQIVEFLEHLLRHLPGKLLVIWDGLPGHRSGLVKDFVAGQKGRLELERLPAYAPELNPVEYLWGHLKHHELPNFCPKNLGELSHHAIRALRRLRRRPTLVAAFWKQSGLFEEGQL
jgi:transposase